ncbi:preprotein translocase subunit SecA [Patescibacteria group bacterium]|nr:preprotein translocase subunit SecA [Patescibacteria group bacterium]
MSILSKILGDPNQKYLDKLQPLVDKINALEKETEKLSDENLKAKTQEFRKRLKKKETLDDILPEAFACVREAARRTLGQRHFDAQLLGGIVLHRGEIAEMRTGEGKTLSSTLPLYLNALSEEGAHLITVNDYLAKRDTVWMGQVYYALGLTVSCIQHDAAFVYDPAHQDTSNKIQDTKKSQIPNSKIQNDEDLDDERDQKGSFEVIEEFLRPVSRKEAYQADITYGTNNEFGFDYLRDNLVQKVDDMAQRKLNYAIVDEVDSILIDEARTPLIISGPAEESAKEYYQFASLVKTLEENNPSTGSGQGDYNIDEKMRAATLTEAGIAKVEKKLGLGNIYVEGGIQLVHHLEQALRAQTLFKRDKDYVVKEGEVLIVDEFTGRLMPGRRYSEGLHQAIEAKEGVQVQRESITLATITFQNYFRMYKKLAGMTGTAVTSAEEFHKVYNLDVAVVPTNKPMIREDATDKVYKTEIGKFKAVIKDVKECQERGQPVLVGTASVEKNEILSEFLEREGISHEALNAKNHEREGAIIAQAGRKGAVTLATNMAGRGVDIVLGGNPINDEARREVLELGGLYVIGTERHEARRIDNQLRGRSGRQGDPGSSQFYVSMEDDIMRIFGSDRVKFIMEKMGIPEDMPIENKMVAKAIGSAQSKVEGHNFDMRKHLLEYDDVINKHRETIYKKRQEILESTEGQVGGVDNEVNKVNDGVNTVVNTVVNKVNKGEDKEGGEAKLSLKDKVLEMIEQEIEQVVSFHTAEPNEKNWNIQEIYEVANTIFPVPKEVRVELGEIRLEAGDASHDARAREKIIKYLIEMAHKEYDKLEERVNSEFGKRSSGGREEIKPFDKLRPGKLRNKEIKGNANNVNGDPSDQLPPRSHSGQAVTSDSSVMRRIERMIMVRAIDMLWVEHLEAMDHMKTGIGLRGYGQRDPLIEYKKESFKMFNELMNGIQKQVVYSIYKVGLAPGMANQQDQPRQMRLSGAAKTMARGSSTGLPQMGEKSGDGVVQLGASSKGEENIKARPRDAFGKKVGRNDPCPCGKINPKTGKPMKYKKCCYSKYG